MNPKKYYIIKESKKEKKYYGVSNCGWILGFNGNDYDIF